jgi:hypothetical protein
MARYWVTPHQTLIRFDGRGTFDYLGRTTGGRWVDRPTLIDKVKDPMVDVVDADEAALIAAYWGASI